MIVNNKNVTEKIVTTVQESTSNSTEITSKNATNLIINQLESWYESFIAILPNLAVAVIVLLLAFFISKWVSKGVSKLLESKVDQKSVRRLISKFASILVVIGGIFIALNILNLNETVNAIIAGAGVSGLVIGLALQGTLSNTLSGIHLSFRKLVRVGDWIQTSGYEGEVISIDLNKFILREADNNTVIIPNKTILENPMKNYTLTKKMRVMINCGIGYESDLDHVEKLAKETMAQRFDQVESTDAVEFYYQEFGDSSINFLLRFWYTAENGLELMRAKSAAIIALKKAFDKEGITIPFPIRTLQFENTLQMEQPSNGEVFSNN